MPLGVNQVAFCLNEVEGGDYVLHWKTGCEGT